MIETMHNTFDRCLPYCGQLVFIDPLVIREISPCSMLSHEEIRLVAKPTLQGGVWATADDHDLIVGVGLYAIQQLECFISRDSSIGIFMKADQCAVVIEKKQSLAACQDLLAKSGFHRFAYTTCDALFLNVLDFPCTSEAHFHPMVDVEVFDDFSVLFHPLALLVLGHIHGVINGVSDIRSRIGVDLYAFGQLFCGAGKFAQNQYTL